MASQRGVVIPSMLQWIPAESRPQAVRDAIQGLTTESSPTDVSLAVALLKAQPDEAARSKLLNYLQTAIECNGLTPVEAACAIDFTLKPQLLDLTSERLCGTAKYMLQRPDEDALVQMNGIIYPDQHFRDVEVVEDVSFEAIRPMLGFARQCISPSSCASTKLLTRLSSAALVFLGATDQTVCRSARDLLSAVISSSREKLLPTHLQIWMCVKELLKTRTDPFYEDLAYSIWLRQAATQPDLLKSWFEPVYWDLIRYGIQFGDVERRKQCLHILRQSMAIAINDKAIRHTVCTLKAGTGQDIGARTVEDSFERYCTVVETVLLSRYLNQVMACEDDLALLASPQSLVPSAWLYTLLAPALGPKVQDSNKKFIGNLIMRLKVQGDSTEQFVEFFRDAFIPWATHGQLFTATLRRTGDRTYCAHGEQLAAYVAYLLVHNTSSGERNGIRELLVDAILEKMMGSRSGSFAYANVYLLEGLAQAFEQTNDLILSPPQLMKFLKLASWSDLPEVARDYILVRCLKICAGMTLRSHEALGIPAVLDATRRWHGLQKKCLQLGDSSDISDHDPVASWEQEMSNRDIMEQQTMNRIKALQKSLHSDAPARMSVEDARTALEDVWGDVEHLEYPKRLLIATPDLVLHPTVVRLATDNDELRSLIVDTVARIQSLSATRLYMLSPLVHALRLVVLSFPEALKVLDIQGLVVTYADNLPKPTIELQLEDAVTNLIQSVAPELKEFGYQYYYGERATAGIAGLLDLVTRLGSLDPKLTKSIFEHLLQRWYEQKLPLPTVSTWKSVLQLQIMLLCNEQVIPQADSSEIFHMLMQLHYVLSIEPLPRYRYLLSWMIIRIYLLREELKPRILAELSTTDHHSNPKYLASLMKVGVTLAKVEGSDAEFALKLASKLVPLAASSKIVIRHEAQWQVPILMEHARKMQWTAISESDAWNALDVYIRSMERFDVPPLERQINIFDPVRDHTMIHLVEGPWWKLDEIESPLCGQRDFAALMSRDAASDLHALRSTPSCIPLGDPATAQTTSSDVNGTRESTKPPSTSPKLVPSPAGETRALQTKGTAYLASDINDELTRRNDLIVIASLVDNPYNLGGLSRVSEIFGAAELHLQNQNVVSNKDFTNVAVSSHLHFPICQLSVPALPAYLAQKRNKGWSIVGIEQTDRSILVGSEACKLPEKTVLVVGSEKEGIPALVLTECDMLVEIPQQGVTRSLNVQTAAGIVLYEYARQHRT